MKPYYDDGSCVIYHGDCREADQPWSGSRDALITDPPYPNNAGHFDDAVEAAREMLSRCWFENAAVFWNELETPPYKAAPLVAVHIWHRANVNGRLYEPIYVFGMGAKRRSEVWRHPAIFDGAGPGCHEYLGHPTQKPLALMGRVVEAVGSSDGTVFDPFMGSGSTLTAAKSRGFRAIGFEIEERYCEIAAKRLAQEVLDFGTDKEGT